MTAILITLAIIANAASYLLGAIIASGARADLEAENTALKQIIKKTYQDADDNLTDSKKYYISHEIFTMLKKSYNIIQNPKN